MRVGFTGTREGLTEQQRDALKVWFVNNWGKIDCFSQGCCVGADEQATEIAERFRHCFPVYALPCTLWKFVSRRAWELSAEVAFPEDALIRNRQIVDNSDLLLACPKGPEEQRSGTWATVRLARKQKVPVVVFWPDGTVTEEKNK